MEGLVRAAWATFGAAAARPPPALVEQGLEPGVAEVHPGRAREGAGSVSNLLVTCPRARSGRGEGGGGLPPTPGCVGDGMWVLALTLGSGRTQPVASGALLQPW